MMSACVDLQEVGKPRVVRPEEAAFYMKKG
jgi:hypothetical protein